MLRPRGTSLGLWSIAALLVTAVAGFVGPAAFLGHSAGAAAPLGAHAPAVPTANAPIAAPLVAPVHPATGNESGNLSASATITSTYTGTNVVPVEIDWTISVVNTSLDASNVSMSLLVMNGPDEVANWSEAVVANQTDYTDMVTYDVLTSEEYNGGILPTSPYTFTIWVTAWNASNGSVPWVNASSAPVTATLGIVNVNGLFSNTLPLYDALPATINWNTTVTGNTGTVIDVNNTTVSLEFRYITSGCNSVFGYGTPCPTISNTSVDFSATGAYSMTFDQSVMQGDFPGGLNPGEYQVIVWTTIINSQNPDQAARTGAIAQYFYPVLSPNAATFLSPSPLENATAGNVTISVAYTAQYLSAANVTVYAGSTSTVVYLEGVFQAAATYHFATVTWMGAPAGTFRMVLSLTTTAGAAGGATSFTSWFNLTAAPTATGGGTVYINTTTYHNTTTASSGNTIAGLSPGVLAAVLLVVGLVVGMIVAMLLGQMMWGGQKPQSPQPWQGKSTTSEPMSSSEQESKDHPKTPGM